jgi:hypothetical protein
MARLQLDPSSQPKPPKTPKGSNAYFPVPPGGAFAWVSAHGAKTSGQVGVYLTVSRSFDRGVEAFDFLISDREASRIDELLPHRWSPAP